MHRGRLIPASQKSQSGEAALPASSYGVQREQADFQEQRGSGVSQKLPC